MLPQTDVFWLSLSLHKILLGVTQQAMIILQKWHFYHIAFSAVAAAAAKKRV